MHVAIIGGGFSGLLAGYLLKKKGIQVTVYEKEEFLGGHCRSLIVNKETIELGTVFSFNDSIRSLLLELNVDFREQFTYRNFIDDHFSRVEQLSRHEVAQLIEELSRLEKILARFTPDLNVARYGYIHQDLLVPVYDFLAYYDLPVISKIMAPHLSSYGFGSIKTLQAYYAFNIFNMQTLFSFIRGEKLLFMNKGFSELISRLACNISDIRYGSAVCHIEWSEKNVIVKTAFEQNMYDKVLISTKLPDNVIRDKAFAAHMKKIETNPYFVCVYETENRNLVTSYFYTRLGEESKIQFFYSYPQKNKSILVAYAYGKITAATVNEITSDLKRSGISIKHLISSKQWEIFPHLSLENLKENFYSEIAEAQKNSPICFIGSLVSRPAIANLYNSVTKFIDDNFYIS